MLDKLIAKYQAFTDKLEKSWIVQRSGSMVTYRNPQEKENDEKLRAFNKQEEAKKIKRFIRYDLLFIAMALTSIAQAFISIRPFSEYVARLFSDVFVPSVRPKLFNAIASLSFGTYALLNMVLVISVVLGAYTLGGSARTALRRALMMSVVVGSLFYGFSFVTTENWWLISTPSLMIFMYLLADHYTINNIYPEYIKVNTRYAVIHRAGTIGHVVDTYLGDGIDTKFNEEQGENDEE
jgi:hypothetical protein